MDVFNLRRQLIGDYKAYSESFITVQDPHIREYVSDKLNHGTLWPDPLVQLNPRFIKGPNVAEMATRGILHPTCAEVFRFDKDKQIPGFHAPLHKHQSDAIEAAHTGDSYVLITGTGSGKSLAYIIPIVDYALRHKSQKGIKAVVVYPMNALANSQLGELNKFLGLGFDSPPVTFARYTGQEGDQERNALKANPPDILLTNYVMLEYIMTRPDDAALVNQMRGMQFLVLDELHTYRGRQGADVSMLVRRVREVAGNPGLQVVGTSATLAGGNTFAEQQSQVAAVASRIFGVTVKPERVIGETLTRLTPEPNEEDPQYRMALSARLLPGQLPPADVDAFINDPLSSWIETTFGLESEPQTGRLRRAAPKSIEVAAEKLSQITGVDIDRSSEAIRETLLAGYREGESPLFAFRLHQFISRGDTVYASLDDGEERHFSLSGQLYVPGDRSRSMLPLAFCRECGQEYYVVTKKTKDSRTHFEERDLGDQAKDAAGETRGFLYRNLEQPWLHHDDEYVLDNIPDSWVAESDGRRKLTPTGRKKLPVPIRLNPLGEEDVQGSLYHFIPQPFSFCLNCGVTYSYTLRSDFSKLSSLSAGGRSTATTVLALSALQTMRQEQYLDDKARKLLSFTDNRQDASLQAGHTNDFVEVGLLRAAIYRAVADAGEEGLEHDLLPQRVFKALNLPFHLYASDPSVKFGRDEFDRALREVLAYRVYHDLRRGWRVAAPNLEQSGLLVIDYKYLSDICTADEEWTDTHAALASASSQTREAISRVLLDYLRRELAIKVDYLRPDYQEQLRSRSNQYLVEPWAIDETELMVNATIAYPCTQASLSGEKRYENVYVSEYGGFGQYLRRSNTLPDYHNKIKLEETAQIISQLLERLRRAALVEVVRETPDMTGRPVKGYQVRAGSFIWQAGAGIMPHHDPIRVPRPPKHGSATNPFFTDFYKKVGAGLVNIRAREHTAQVPSIEREKREEAFREARLPILYCSPTMELGVDISQLNVVNMRNVPPTPANYAQRSGRAGRSGQPALVFTYCTTGSPHDQYHFRRPHRMVGGAVSTPRLDLGNEELVRSHIHSVWMAETGAKLGISLRDVLDLNDQVNLPIQTSLLQDLKNPAALERTRQRAGRILATIADDLANAPWYDEGWLDRQLNQVVERFDRACDRWRGLFLSAKEQQRIQNEIVKDPSRPEKDRRIAALLRKEAETQLSLLTSESNVFQGDFYSYRYFASEGFLPGYNFPRLPLSAYIPARTGRRSAEDEFISRPRFLAISEFGPSSIIYHEGSRYVINRVILPVGDRDGETAVPTITAKLCPACGYLHPIDGEHDSENCERCGAKLTRKLHDLFRMQNVEARRRDRISSDEEERFKQGYELITAVRFAEYGRSRQSAEAVDADGDPLWKMTYGDAATIWRINQGWSRRQNKNELGFWLDAERGYWKANENDPETDVETPLSPRLMRVIPFVEDRKNVLFLEPAGEVDEPVMASLQSALQKAIQARFQLEDNELSVEALPSARERRMLLFYESSEGGAGVLRQLVEDPGALAEVAAEALRICHFDPDTGADLHHAPNEREDCGLACYDCLMSYYNQPDHRQLDRWLIRDTLLALKDMRILASPNELSRAEHLIRLRNLTQSGLEREWLDLVEGLNLRLPNHAQHLIASCGVRPDFYYEVNGYQLAIFVDGPPHNDPQQMAADQEKVDKLFLSGIESMRFDYRQREGWEEALRGRPNIFGTGA